MHLSFEVLDRISLEVLRGFGAVPKRGAEVGGVLLGRTSGADVIVDSHESVSCDYLFGPSYQLAEKDLNRFQDAVKRAADGGPLIPVGYYRSDTRESLTLSGEDHQLLDRFFPAQAALALLIRPYATKVSRAGFFVRAEDGFPGETPMEFAFSRQILGGGSRGRTPERATRLTMAATQAIAAPPPPPTAIRAEPVETIEAPIVETELPRTTGTRRDVWAAALTLAVALGWGAGYFVARETAPPPDPSAYRLGLASERDGTQLRVSWDPSVTAMRTAVRGELRVGQDGATKTVPLGLEELLMGESVYPQGGGAVRFELRVLLTSGTVLSQVVETTPRASAAP